MPRPRPLGWAAHRLNGRRPMTRRELRQQKQRRWFLCLLLLLLSSLRCGGFFAPRAGVSAGLLPRAPRPPGSFLRPFLLLPGLAPRRLLFSVLPCLALRCVASCGGRGSSGALGLSRSASCGLVGPVRPSSSSGALGLLRGLLPLGSLRRSCAWVGVGLLGPSASERLLSCLPAAGWPPGWPWPRWGPVLLPRWRVLRAGGVAANYHRLVPGLTIISTACQGPEGPAKAGAAPGLINGSATWLAGCAEGLASSAASVAGGLTPASMEAHHPTPTTGKKNGPSAHTHFRRARRWGASGKVPLAPCAGRPSAGWLLPS